MKNLTLIFIFSLIVLSAGASYAGYMRAEATPESSPGKIQISSPFTIDIYMNNNDADLYGYSWPLAFYSPDGITNAVHRNVGGYSADIVSGGSYNDSSILMVNDFDTYWTMLNQWTGFGWDGVLPDTINHTTATLDSWPAGLGEVLNVQFAFRIDEPGTFCIDSISHPDPVYDWLFDYPMNFGGPYCWEIICEGDADCDGVSDATDNCPDIYNPGQEDTDGDDIGDICDECPNDPQNDIDDDGFCADVDNCPDTYNPDQSDSDGDNAGDVCDNCNGLYNPGQQNSDSDAFGDACDNCPYATNPDQADNDADSVGNVCDNCPDSSNADQLDSDDDGIGDVCDDCPLDPENDADGDGYCGDVDNCPNIYNPDQADSDEDGVGDVCEYICGDVNEDEKINILDITYMISYFFKMGPPPNNWQAADVNADCWINILDIARLIDFLYHAGPELNCPTYWPCETK